MKTKKILIVEDEATSRKIISLALGGTNRVLLYAKDGDEAVSMTLEHRPDLIIMDVMLPKLNGYEAARIIKSNSEVKHIPLIAITARTADYDEAKAREAGCDDYITKPYRVGQLRDRLSRYLADE